MKTLKALLMSAIVFASLPGDEVAAQDTYAQHVFSESGPTDPQELEAFLDTLFQKKMAELHVPGAVFVLVKDGQIYFSKGYGYADVENRIPVDPERTLFRIASVAKVVTGTAVMQLVERGLLDLDKDVNDYVTLFKLKNNFGKPVTTAHLLTHTSGFDDRYIGKVGRTPAEQIPLGMYQAA